jgi:hypothetical protein
MGDKRFAAARRLWDRLLREPLVVPGNPIGPFAVMTSGQGRAGRRAVEGERPEADWAAAPEPRHGDVGRDGDGCRRERGEGGARTRRGPVVGGGRRIVRARPGAGATDGA